MFSNLTSLNWSNSKGQQYTWSFRSHLQTLRSAKSAEHLQRSSCKIFSKDINSTQHTSHQHFFPFSVVAKSKKNARIEINFIICCSYLSWINIQICVSEFESTCPLTSTWKFILSHAISSSGGWVGEWVSVCVCVCASVCVCVSVSVSVCVLLSSAKRGLSLPVALSILFCYELW